jgi:hypothetical protein
LDLCKTEKDATLVEEFLAREPALLGRIKSAGPRRVYAGSGDGLQIRESLWEQQRIRFAREGLSRWRRCPNMAQ